MIHPYPPPMTESRVVACINCKWFVEGYSYPKRVGGIVAVPHSCEHPICYQIQNPEKTDPIYGKNVKSTFKRTANYSDLNKNNNCYYYERKWWKFWV